MAVKRLLQLRPQYDDGNGALASGYRLFFYAAGSSTKQNTYSSNTGPSANTNPIVLNALGEPAVEIWGTVGQTYKIGLAIAGTDDPPASFVWTEDNVAPINDTTVALDEWVSGPAPTFVSGLSFTLAGDQTTAFHVGRRLKTTNSGGTVYSTIITSAFAALTTITVENDSGALDAGLSAVSYGIISQSNEAAPAFTDQAPVVVNKTDRTKRVRLSAAGLTTGKTRVLTLPDQDFTIGPLLRNYLAGLTMSTAGGSATMTVGAGMATDSTNAIVMSPASSIGKTTAAWAVGTGNGGLDTGAIANSTWYHFYLIERTDTQVVDVLFSLSASAPTMPANYSFKRRIGSGKTDGSAQWTAFVQDGDFFQWLSPVLDVNVNNPGTAAVTRTLTVPTGVNVIALMNVEVAQFSNAGLLAVYLSDLAVTDLQAVFYNTDAAATPLATLAVDAASATDNRASAQAQVRTNTSAQIRSRIRFSDLNSFLLIATTAWRDSRGKDS